MRSAKRGMAGVRVMVLDGEVDVAGWCGPSLEPDVVAGRIEAELTTVSLEPGDLDGDFDYFSIWCAPTGLVDGLMLLRGQHGGLPLRVLTTAAAEFLTGGGLSAPGPPPSDE